MTINNVRERKIIPTLLFSLLLLFVFFASDTARGMRNGMEMCMYTVVPSLLPAMILTDALSSYREYGGKRTRLSLALSKLMGCGACGPDIFVMGLLCGAPMGIRRVCRCYESGEITKKEAEHLLTFTSNAGAAFVIAGVGAAMRGSVADGAVLFFVQICASFFIAVILRPRCREVSESQPTKAVHENFADAISKCAGQMTVICVCICFFSVLCEFASKVFSGTVLAAVCSVFEMTCGVRRINSLPIHPDLSMCMTAGAIGLGGMGIMMQNMHFTSEVGLSVLPYIKGKVLCSVLSVCLCAVFCLIFR